MQGHPILLVSYLDRKIGVCTIGHVGIGEMNLF